MREMISLILICKICISSCWKLNDDKLLGIIDIFRHGARSPTRLDKNNRDIIKSEWNIENGQLTAVGIRQLYLQGYRTRIKHILTRNNSERILEKEYDPLHIKIYSTPLDRNIQSAYSKMLGIFPPGTSKKLNQNRTEYTFPPLHINKSELLINDEDPIPGRIQPVPLHILENKFIYLYLTSECIGLNFENGEYPLENEKTFEEHIFRIEKNIMPKLKSKLNNEIYSAILNNKEELLLAISDAIACNKFDKKKFEVDLSLEDLVLLERYKDFYFLERLPSHKMKSILASSPMFNFAIEYGEGLLQKTEKRKYIGFSVHDTNIGYFLSFLQKFPNLKFKPSTILFNSNIVIKFYKSGIIYIYYDTNLLLRTNISLFKEIFNKYLLSSNELEKFCSGEISQFSFKRNSMWMIFLFIFFLGTNITLVTIIFYKKHSYREFIEADSKLDRSSDVYTPSEKDNTDTESIIAINSLEEKNN